MQKDISKKMRAVLLDWLVDVHLKFRLLPETLFLTVNIIDRFLEKVCIKRQKLQLVGVTAMFIASKYEEIYAPELRDFAYVTDSAYTKKDILKMEGIILNELEFNVTTTSPLRFLNRYSSICGMSPKCYHLALYLLELSLIDYRMVKHTPSNLACSAIYLVNKITNVARPWSE